MSKRGKRGAKAAGQAKDKDIPQEVLEEPPAPAPAAAPKVPSSPLTLLAKALTPRRAQQQPASTPGDGEDTAPAPDQAIPPTIAEDPTEGETEQQTTRQTTGQQDLTPGAPIFALASEAASKRNRERSEPPTPGHADQLPNSNTPAAGPWTSFASLLHQGLGLRGLLQQQLQRQRSLLLGALLLLLLLVLGQGVALRRQSAAMRAHDQQLHQQQEALQGLQASFSGILQQLEQQLPELSALDASAATCSTGLSQLTAQQQDLAQQVSTFQSSMQHLATEVSQASSTAAAAVSLHQQASQAPPPAAAAAQQQQQQAPTLEQLSHHVQQTLQSHLPELLFAHRDLALAACGATVSSHSKLASKPTLSLTLHKMLRRSLQQQHHHQGPDPAAALAAGGMPPSDLHPLADTLLLSAKHLPGRCLRLALNSGPPAAAAGAAAGAAPAFVDIRLPGLATVTAVSLHLPRGLKVAPQQQALLQSGSAAGQQGQQPAEQQQAAVQGGGTEAAAAAPAGQQQLVLPSTFPKMVLVSALNGSSYATQQQQQHGSPSPAAAPAAAPGAGLAATVGASAAGAPGAAAGATAFTLSLAEVAAAGQQGRVVVHLQQQVVADHVRLVVLAAIGPGSSEVCLHRVSVHGKPVEGQAGVFMC